MDENQNNQQQDNAKITKQYNSVIEKLTSVLKGGKLEFPSKVKNDQMSDLIDDLFEEETKQNEEKFKTNLKDLLKKKMEFDREVSKKEKELAQLKIQKQKEFVQKANEVFNQIENVNVIHSEYLKSLNEIAEAQEEKPGIAPE